MKGRRWALVVGAVVVVAAGTALWVAVRGGGGEELAAPVAPSPSPSPPPPQYFLAADLTNLKGSTVEGSVPRPRLRTAGQAIRDTLTGLYTTGFVDPAQWQGGSFPALPGFFAGEARGRAQADLKHLSLGGAANHLVAVRPERALLEVRIVANANRRPVAATAAMDFRATGLGDAGLEVPIRHEGRYVLQLIEGRWLVVAYGVEGRLGA